jgi:hypothetical protein
MLKAPWLTGAWLATIMPMHFATRQETLCLQNEVQRLRHEIEILRTALNASAGRDVNDDDLHSARSSFQRMSAAVENEVLKDSPYIAEIGRILGMV